MSKKISLIGFNKTKYKSVKYVDQEIEVNEFIKFYYGASAPEAKLKPIIGKVTKLYTKGVEIITDFGWMNAEWSRIDRIFKIKTSGRLKESKISAVNGQSPIPIIDSAITRIIQQIQDKKIDIKLKESRVNTSSTYKRTVQFTKTGNIISIVIPNKSAKEAVVKGLKRKTSIKPNKSGKISSAIIKKIVNAVDDLSKSCKIGLLTL